MTRLNPLIESIESIFWSDACFLVNIFYEIIDMKINRLIGYCGKISAVAIRNFG